MRAIKLVGGYAEEIVASACLVLMSGATFANVISRYGLNSPIPWAEELARYSFIWLVFTGAAVCTKRGRHVAVDVAVKLLPESGQAYCKLLANLGVAVLMAILIYYGLVLTTSATQPTSTLGIPTYFVYMVVPLSALSILVRTVVDLAGDVRKIMGPPS